MTVTFTDDGTCLITDPEVGTVSARTREEAEKGSFVCIRREIICEKVNEKIPAPGKVKLHLSLGCRLSPDQLVWIS